MTLEEIKEISQREISRDGALSKGIRVAILEKAKAGEEFDIIATHFDITRIGAELRRSSQGKRMRVKRIKQGQLYNVTFNETK